MSMYEININPSEVDPDGTSYRGKTNKLNQSESNGFSGSWNDLTDKPFNIEVTETVAIVDNVTIDGFDNSNGYYATNTTLPFALAEDTTYTVTWDGVAYNCASYLTSSGALLIGNAAIVFGGSDTGEPFVMNLYGCATWIYTTDEGSSHTVSVARVAKAVVDAKRVSDVVVCAIPKYDLGDRVVAHGASSRSAGEDWIGELHGTTSIKSSMVTVGERYAVVVKDGTTGGVINTIYDLVAEHSYCCLTNGRYVGYYCVKLANSDIRIECGETYSFWVVRAGAVASVDIEIYKQGEPIGKYIPEDNIPDTIMRVADLPKATAVADATEAPTAENFNALLASLRAAGYLAN